MPQDEFTPDRTTTALYPEATVGGYSHLDVSIEFYSRINALLDQDSHVLDFGAGRGWWAHEPVPPLHRKLRWLKGRVARSVGTDVDAAVLENPALDEAHVVGIGEPLPFPDASFDVVIADYVLEHVNHADVAQVSGEIMRVLKPGGYFAARTPNKWGFIGIAARAVPNGLHTKVLKVLQPNRKVEDVFPVRYAMNTRRQLRRAFPGQSVVVYGQTGEPAYFGTNVWVWRFVDLISRFIPRRLAPTLTVFVRKQR